MVHVREQSQALADAVAEALPGWIVRCVERIAVAYFGSLDPAMAEAGRAAGDAAALDVIPRMRRLLATDVDEQRANPLSLLRGAVRYPTEVLRQAGVPPVERDDYALAQFPDDDYDLTPTSFAEVDPALVAPGVAWGAAKAWTHRQRHEGA